MQNVYRRSPIITFDDIRHAVVRLFKEGEVTSCEFFQKQGMLFDDNVIDFHARVQVLSERPKYNTKL